MDWGGPNFIVAIVLVSMIGWILNTWIRAKHGYPLEDEWGGKTEKPDASNNRDTQRLQDQNKQLLETMEKMQDRMVVLERIVTDKGYTVAEEIEALRDTPRSAAADSGVPLNIDSKEKA